MQSHSTAQFRRIETQGRTAFRCVVDGVAVDMLEGDTVLTAILAQRRHVRAFEFSDARRAGFCLMGACQDCWVRSAAGEPIRACTTLVQPGMAIVTEPAASRFAGSEPGHD